MKCPSCLNPTNKIITEKLRREENVRVFLCEFCDLGFLDNISQDLSEYKKYYQTKYRKEHAPRIYQAPHQAPHQETNAQELFDHYAGFQEGRLQLASPHINKNTRLLEIGCSAGQFLYHVRNLVEEAIGIELDPTASSYAEKKTGCKVHKQDLSEIGFKNHSFDMICAFQVLEHIPNPQDFLASICSLLKPEGVLYLEVPNLHDVLPDTYDLPYHHQFYFHPAHLFYYSKKSLSELLKRSGFEGKITFSQDYNILNHFQWILNDRPQSSCIPGLSKPALPFRNTASSSVKEKLDLFLQRVDLEYKNLLEELEISSNISFIGKRRMI